MNMFEVLDRQQQKERLKILIVDDDQIYRSLASEVMKGHKRFVAKASEEGFERYLDVLPDIVFLDIDLPDHNGLWLLQKIRHFNPEAFVVMLTSSRLAKDVEMARQCGASGYIVKPFSRDDVMKCFDKYRTYMQRLDSMDPADRALLHAVAPPEPDDETEAEKSAREALLESWRVLFADDYHVNCENAHRALVKLGCMVDTAVVGSEAKMLINMMDYDLLFLDIGLPDIDGYALAQMVRANNKHIFIIGLVDEGSWDSHDKRWLEVGMNEVVPKPLGVKRLQQLVKKYVDIELEGYVE